MLNSIIGNLAKPLGTTEDIDQIVFSLSSHMDSQNRGTALFFFVITISRSGRRNITAATRASAKAYIVDQTG